MVTKTRPRSVSKTRHVYSTTTSGAVNQDFSTKYTFSWNDTHTGVDNPGWRARILQGLGATTPANGSRRVESGFPEGNCHTANLNNPKQRGEAHGAIDHAPPRAGATGFNYSKADSIARLALIEDVRRVQQGFSTGTFLGELRETLKMIKSPAKAIRNGLDAYYRQVKKRGRNVSGRDFDRIASQTWLEYNFGWKPLARDIESACENLLLQPDRYRVLVRGKGEVQGPRIGSRDSLSPVLAANFDMVYESTETTVVRLKGAMRADRHPVPTLRERWGIRAADFLPTAWELIPYSFLVDYFTNIGDVISACTEGPVYLAWGNSTSRGERNIRLQSASFRPSPGFYGSGSCGGYTSNYVSFVRASINSVSVGIADTRWELPEFNSKKWLNIGALARLRT